MIRAIILLALWAAALAAIPPPPGDPIDKPVPGARVNYTTLLRLVCSDLEVEENDALRAKATGVIGIRELGSDKVPEPVEDVNFDIQSVKTVALLRSPQPRALISFVMPALDGDQLVRYLALFDLAPALRLVDVVSVYAFPDDAGDFDSHFALNPTTDAYVYQSFHSNSSQGYQSTTILFVRGDRIEKIAEINLLNARGWEDVQGYEENEHISTAPAAGRPYRDVVIRVEFKLVADDQESEHRPLRRGSIRYYSAVYRWDAAAHRFVTTSKELDALDKFNRDHN